MRRERSERSLDRGRPGLSDGVGEHDRERCARGPIGSETFAAAGRLAGKRHRVRHLVGDGSLRRGDVASLPRGAHGATSAAKPLVASMLP